MHYDKKLNSIQKLDNYYHAYLLFQCQLLLTGVKLGMLDDLYRYLMCTFEMGYQKLLTVPLIPIY